MDPKLCENEVNKLPSPASRLTKRKFFTQFHTTWGPPFRASLPCMFGIYDLSKKGNPSRLSPSLSAPSKAVVAERRLFLRRFLPLLPLRPPAVVVDVVAAISPHATCGMMKLNWNRWGHP